MYRKKNRNIIYLTILLLSFQASVFAQSFPIPDPPITGAKSYLLIDSVTGKDLATYEPDMLLAPASLTKLMTAYVIFNALQQEQITLEDEVTVSEKAWRTEGSRMFIEPGDRVSIENLIKGLVILSGNDAAVALAEYVAGSVAAFVGKMNQAAAGLNLNGTHYVNSTGLPHPDHFSTARDISRLAGAITQQFPEHYRYYSMKEFGWKGIHQKNRNKLLWRDETVDGVKTGHTRSAGYCLVGSAERDGMRLIASVLGAQSKTKRADAVYALLRYGFASYDSKTVYRGGSKIVTAKVYKSVSPSLAVGVGSDIRLTLPKTPGRQLDADIRLNEPLVAPIVKGSTVGTLTLRLNGDEIGAHPLVALGDAVPGSWAVKAYDTLRLWVR